MAKTTLAVGQPARIRNGGPKGVIVGTKTVHDFECWDEKSNSVRQLTVSPEALEPLDPSLTIASPPPIPTPDQVSTPAGHMDALINGDDTGNEEVVVKGTDEEPLDVNDAESIDMDDDESIDVSDDSVVAKAPVQKALLNKTEEALVVIAKEAETVTTPREMGKLTLTLLGRCPDQDLATACERLLAPKKVKGEDPKKVTGVSMTTWNRACGLFDFPPNQDKALVTLKKKMAKITALYPNPDPVPIIEPKGPVTDAHKTLVKFAESVTGDMKRPKDLDALLEKFPEDSPFRGYKGQVSNERLSRATYHLSGLNERGSSATWKWSRGAETSADRGTKAWKDRRRSSLKNVKSNLKMIAFFWGDAAPKN